jgi:serine/threonine protein kinase
MYRCVTPHPGVPELLWNGVASDGRRGIALELLGPSLDDLFTALQRSISIPTLCAVAIALVDRIAWLHSRGIVHRDVKPQNFLCGRIALDKDDGRGRRPHVAFSPAADDIFVVDFGLAKAFNTRSGHVQFKRHQGRAGTARYASINTHKGCVQSRRDDLEAIGYMLVFLHKGRLPWQGVKASSRRHKHKLICAVKAATPLAELCEGMPHAFALYIDYARRLTFSEQPDYDYCKSFFEAVLRETPLSRPDWADLDPEAFACISALAALPKPGAAATSTPTAKGLGGAVAAAGALKPAADQETENLSAGDVPARTRVPEALPPSAPRTSTRMLVDGPTADAPGSMTPPLQADALASCSVGKRLGEGRSVRSCSPRRTRSNVRQRVVAS